MKQWLECVLMIEIFGFEFFNPFVCVNVWFGLIFSPLIIAQLAVSLYIKIKTYTSIVSGCNLDRKNNTGSLHYKQWQSIELFCRLIVENCTMISLSMNDLELSLVKCTCY